jgi:hypothetical protein
MGICGSKIQEVVGGWRIFDNEYLHNSCSTKYLSNKIKDDDTGSTCNTHGRNEYKVGKPKRMRRPFGRLRRIGRRILT